MNWISTSDQLPKERNVYDENILMWQKDPYCGRDGYISGWYSPTNPTLGYFKEGKFWADAGYNDIQEVQGVEYWREVTAPNKDNTK